MRSCSLLALLLLSRIVHPFSLLPDAATTTLERPMKVFAPMDAVSNQPTTPVLDHPLLLAQSLPSPRTQAQQMSDAMALKTLQGTKWRLFVELPTDKSQSSLTLIFQGFANQPNKGIVQLTGSDQPPTTGRWLSKPSEIRRGTVQLSARWKIKVPGESSYIFKGFIQAVPTYSTGGTVDAQMTGTILSAETEEVVGKFRADLIAIDVSDEELRM